MTGALLDICKEKEQGKYFPVLHNSLANIYVCEHSFDRFTMKESKPGTSLPVLLLSLHSRQEEAIVQHMHTED